MYKESFFKSEECRKNYENMTTREIIIEKNDPIVKDIFQVLVRNPKIAFWDFVMPGNDSVCS